MVVAVAALVGTPTAGAFVDIVDQARFNQLIIFSGALLLAGGVTLGIARLSHSARLFAVA